MTTCSRSSFRNNSDVDIMPRGRSTVIVSFAARTGIQEDDDSDGDTSCDICYHAYCLQNECQRGCVECNVCSHSLCCLCASKQAKLCRCTDACTGVILLCPFCREVMPISAREMYLSSRPLCQPCVRQQAGELVPHTSPQQQEEASQPAT